MAKRRSAQRSSQRVEKKYLSGKIVRMDHGNGSVEIEMPMRERGEWGSGDYETDCILDELEEHDICERARRVGTSGVSL